VESVDCTESDFWLHVELPGLAEREIGLVSTASDAGPTVRVTGIVRGAELLFGVIWIDPSTVPGIRPRAVANTVKEPGVELAGLVTPSQEEPFGGEVEMEYPTAELPLAVKLTDCDEAFAPAGALKLSVAGDAEITACGMTTKVTGMFTSWLPFEGETRRLMLPL